MLPSRLVAVGLVAGVVVWTGHASAGWVIDQVVQGQGEGSRQQVVVQANRLKTAVSGPDGNPTSAFILDLNTETITQVDYGDRHFVTATIREYAEMLRGAQQAMAQHLHQAMKQMQEALKDMPPEQRPLTTITAWRELDGRKLEQAMAEMARGMPRCGPGQGRPGPALDDLSWKLLSEGYPLRTVSRGPGGSTIEVTRAESRAVPASEFQPPPGFARKTLQEVMGRKE